MASQKPRHPSGPQPGEPQRGEPPRGGPPRGEAHQGEPKAAFLQNRFNLTGAEARLVVHLARGISLKSSAKALGVGYETVRRHIKSAFRKTGTHRQAELLLVVIRALDEVFR